MQTGRKETRPVIGSAWRAGLVGCVLAAGLAFAVAELVRRAGRRGLAVAAGLLVLVALDLVVQPVSATAADPDNAAYAALEPGRSTLAHAGAFMRAHL